MKTAYRRRWGGSDLRRWSQVSNLSPSWDARTQRIAAMISSTDSVLEFGAGRRVLQGMLSSTNRYTPSDLVDRGAGTFVCDLNERPLRPFPPHDVAVFSGVLEYVNDIRSLLDTLKFSVHTIIASYAILECNPDDRRVGGWVNDHTSSEFIDLFSKAGFTCMEQVPWQNQVIYRFTSSRPSTTA